MLCFGTFVLNLKHRRVIQRPVSTQYWRHTAIQNKFGLKTTRTLSCLDQSADTHKSADLTPADLAPPLASWCGPGPRQLIPGNLEIARRLWRASTSDGRCTPRRPRPHFDSLVQRRKWQQNSAFSNISRSLRIVHTSNFMYVFIFGRENHLFDLNSNHLVKETLLNTSQRFIFSSLRELSGRPPSWLTRPKYCLFSFPRLANSTTFRHWFCTVPQNQISLHVSPNWWVNGIRHRHLCASENSVYLFQVNNVVIVCYHHVL